MCAFDIETAGPLAPGRVGDWRGANIARVVAFGATSIFHVVLARKINGAVIIVNIDGRLAASLIVVGAVVQLVARAGGGVASGFIIVVFVTIIAGVARTAGARIAATAQVAAEFTRILIAQALIGAGGGLAIPKGAVAAVPIAAIDGAICGHIGTFITAR